ncbi:MAG: MMPL family transporter [Candidatus Sericytochromatia bacterium]|nr:MMPL family transporter [Candidatus Sericytochromatia bacterium]
MSNHQHPLARWGRWVARRRHLVICAWLLIFLGALVAAKPLAGHLQSGTGSIAGTASAQAEQVLRQEFRNPFAQSLVLTLQGPEWSSEAGQHFLADLQTRLRAHPGVAQVLTAESARHLRSRDPHGTLVVLGLNATDLAQAEALVAPLRSQVSHLCAAAPWPVVWHLTGRPALTHDINAFSMLDTRRAEGRSLPLTALVLLLAFGSLVAAGLPLLVGVFAIIGTVGILGLIAPYTPLSTYTQSVASMLGLALGIDYALLMVSRFRESLRAGLGVEQAVGETTHTAGRAVLISGLTVAIGFAGLLGTRVLDSQSMGIGGLLVALVSILLSLSLLPACLAVLGASIDAPRALRLRWLLPSQPRWETWVRHVVHCPKRYLLGSTVLLLLLASPIIWLKNGFPTGDWLPPGLPYQQGFRALAGMGQAGLVAPIDVILRVSEDDRRTSALAVGNLPALIRYTRTLEADPRVAHVISPVTLSPQLNPLSLALLYADQERLRQRFPLLADVFLSQDRQATALQVILKQHVTFEGSKQFALELASRNPAGFTVTVGGQAAFFNDFDRVMGATVLPVAAFIVAATFAALAWAFRSLLAPLKAICLNGLSVGAGLGVVVAVFQFGWGIAWFGHPTPFEQIPLTVSLSLFCIVFGLSMDYEVFLLARIKEAYDQGQDSASSVVEGISATAGIVTSAAAIMLCVFGAFARAEFAVVQMLGVGLAVAVAVDATLVRLVLLPASLSLLGDWNWYPGGRRPKAEESR